MSTEAEEVFSTVEVTIDEVDNQDGFSDAESTSTVNKRFVWKKNVYENACTTSNLCIIINI